MKIRDITVAVSVALGSLYGLTHGLNGSADTASYIVEGHNGVSAAQAVRDVGGRVVLDLPIIQGVSARLSTAQVAALHRISHIDLFLDGPVKTATTTTQTGTNAIEKYAPTLVGADKLAAQGISGNGVTVAVLDSGLWDKTGAASGAAKVMNDLNGKNKMLDTYDPTAGEGISLPDAYGHGTHVTSVIGSPDTSIDGKPLGIAPMAKLVFVRAFNSSGNGTYSSVINGINWIYSHKQQYNIRVANLSFGAKPQSFYWNDPIDQAVMTLWRSGVVVVASAGNFGPTA
jgi:serine protease AprX